MSKTGSGVRAARYAETVRTLPEQIADDLGASIARGDLAGGHRLLEQEVAQRYGVSRGPVREALRILALRGLAILYPRRGAFVVEISLDSMVDLFNVRAVLMGLAAQYFAVMAIDSAREELGKSLAELDRAQRSPNTDVVSFQQITRQIGLTIYRNCGSDALSQLIEHQNESSAWSSLWKSGRIDFQTAERRREATADYLKLGDAIGRHDGPTAEAEMRHILDCGRESAIAELSQMRGETVDGRRLVAAPRSSARVRQGR